MSRRRPTAGQALVEYALLVLFVCVAVLVAIGYLRDVTGDFCEQQDDALTTPTFAAVAYVPPTSTPTPLPVATVAAANGPIVVTATASGAPTTVPVVATATWLAAGAKVIVSQLAKPLVLPRAARSVPVPLSWVPSVTWQLAARVAGGATAWRAAGGWRGHGARPGGCEAARPLSRPRYSPNLNET